MSFFPAPVCNVSGSSVCGCDEAVCGVPLCDAPVADPPATTTAPSSSGTPTPLSTPASFATLPPIQFESPSASAAEVRTFAVGVVIGIVVGVVAFVALIVVGIVIFFRRRGRNGTGSNSEPLAPVAASGRGEYDTMTEIDAESNQRVSAAKQAASKGLKPEWIIPFEDLVFGNRLGEGAFGIVFKGRWKATEVAFVFTNSRQV
jgi:hypothetical protein